MRHEVTAIDLAAREVVARGVDSGEVVRERFDDLVYAPGASPVRPDWAGTGIEGVFGVQTLDDGAAVIDWLAPRGPRTAVVVGGGYIGVEMAEALVRHGLDVTLVEKMAEPMSTVDPDMGRLVRDAICGIGIDVRTGVTVTALEEQDGRVSAVVTDAGPLPADVVVLGLGVRPNSRLANEAGLPVGRTGGVVTDVQMRVADGVSGGRGLRRDGAPGQRPAGARAIGHPRQQAGPGRRDQHRRRVRDVPGRRRHGGDQGLRPGGGPHRPAGAGGRRGRVRVRDRHGEVDQPGRVLPGRRPR